MPVVSGLPDNPQRVGSGDTEDQGVKEFSEGGQGGGQSNPESSRDATLENCHPPPPSAAG